MIFIKGGKEREIIAVRDIYSVEGVKKRFGKKMPGKWSSLLTNRVQVLSRIQSCSAREVIKLQANREPSGFPYISLYLSLS